MRKVSIHITREQQDAIIATCENILQNQRREALDNAADLADKLHNATSDVAKHQLKNQRHDVLAAVYLTSIAPAQWSFHS